MVCVETIEEGVEIRFRAVPEAKDVVNVSSPEVDTVVISKCIENVRPYLAHENLRRQHEQWSSHREAVRKLVFFVLEGAYVVFET